MVKITLPLIYAQQQSITPLVHEITSQSALSYAASQQQALQSLEKTSKQIGKSQKIKKQKIDADDEMDQKAKLNFIDSAENSDNFEDPSLSGHDSLSGNLVNIKT